MHFRSQIFRTLLCITSIASALIPPQTVLAQDLVASEELTAGSSCFVWRESRKKPQGHLTAARSGPAAAKRRAMSTSAQIAALAKKRKAAQAAARKAMVAAAANRKLALSNTLTAKAEGFLDGGQTDQAITNFREALIQNPKNARASDGLSNALVSKGIDVAGDANNEAAIVFFDEAVKIDKQNDVAYAKLGAIYDAKGQTDKAVANYEKALAINPEYSTLYAPLGMGYVERGEVAKAEESVKKAEAAGVDTAEVRFLKGLVALKENQNPEAIAAFDKALQLDGSNAMAIYYRGQALDRSGLADQAIAAYKQALAADPTFAPASFDLGVVYYNKGDYSHAAVAYQDAVKYDSTNYQAHANLASTYRQLERFADANAEYKIASQGINTPDLYTEWGYCLGKVKDWEKSVARLETAAEMSPTAIDNTNVSWAYYNSGQEQTAAKNDAKAKEDFEKSKTYSQKAVDQDPKLDAAYVNLGASHNALGEFQLAVQILTQVLGMHKNWSIAMNQLGLGYRGLGDLANAITTFKNVTNFDAKNTYGLYNLGSAYVASGNKNEAKKVNDKLKKLDPALASQLDNVIAGRVVDAAQQKVQNKVQEKIPIKIPRKFPF